MGKRATRRGSVAEDIVVILMLLSEAKNQGLSQLTKTQIHKFLFVSEQKMWQSRILSTNLDFIKMPQGPWSPDIENILSSLNESGLVEISTVETKQNDNAILTKLNSDAEEFIESVVSNMTDSPDLKILRSIRSTIKKYGELSSEDLQEKSHRMKNLISGAVIEDIPPRQYILRPRTEAQATEVFDVNDDIDETLAIIMNPKLRRNIENAIKNAREQPLKVVASLDDLEE